MEELQYQIDMLNALNLKMSENEKMYQMICDSSEDIFIFYNYLTKQVKVFGKRDAIFNFKIEEEKDFNIILDCISREDMESIRDVLFLENKNETHLTKIACLADYKTWLSFSADIFSLNNSESTYKMIRIKNITNTKNHTDELEYLAYYDTLTGLYNRNNFIRLLTKWISSKEKNENIAVMLIDVNGFRMINDGMGMLAGDELIQLLGAFLNNFQDDCVLVSHFSGGLFGIAINGAYGKRSVENIYLNIQDRIKNSFIRCI